MRTGQQEWKVDECFAFNAVKVEDKPSLCLLEADVLDPDSVPVSARFPGDYQVGVILISDQEELHEIGELSGQLQEDVQLALKLANEVRQLLACVAGQAFRYKSDGSLDEMGGELDSMWHTPFTAEQPSLDFAFIVGHGDQEKVGELSDKDLDDCLSFFGVKEAVMLVCKGGCSQISKRVSRDRTVVACDGPVDVRSAYIFAINYMWKRFGDGASAAQALGASNVVLANDPYQLWCNGVRV